MNVHPSSRIPINSFDPRMGEVYPPMIQRLKAHGMRVFQQLWHGGRNTLAIDGGPSWAPSAIPGPSIGVVPMAMTKGMIDELIAAFADAAHKCELWGVDGVEFHAAHGYLAAQFLAPNTNFRTDEYGGSLENRSRFVVEALTAMRAAVSPGFVIGIRIGDDLTQGGIRYGEHLTLLRQLEQSGLIDYASVSIANYSTLEKMVAGIHEPAAYQLPTSTPITHSIKGPTMVVGRFRTLEEADQVISAGDADMVVMTRAHIADPDIVRKTLSGHPEQVRPCIACNQGCLGGVSGPSARLGCTVNPAVGFETSMGEDKLPPAGIAKKILVVGGGPAGMEAARVAAMRGHHVILAESQAVLGGQLRLAAMAPARRGIFDIAQWQEREMLRHGVEVRLGTRMEADDIQRGGFDQVILATGSTPRMDGVQALHPGEPIEGMSRPNVVSSHALFSMATQNLGHTAVVIDDTGHMEAVAVTEHLVAHGVEVTFVTRLGEFAPHLAVTLARVPALQRLSQGRCNILTDMRALAVDDGGVVIGPTYLPRGSKPTRVPADIVVFVSANRPNRDLFDSLVDSGIPATAIGDARSPRDLQAAIREGYLEGARA
jgi:2,4-dienoyl-CoA reductase-like NADH-dependent reductase (Old Yellow Enzyme family)/thioredoxin reductase